MLWLLENLLVGAGGHVDLFTCGFSYLHIAKYSYAESQQCEHKSGSAGSPLKKYLPSAKSGDKCVAGILIHTGESHLRGCAEVPPDIRHCSTGMFLPIAVDCVANATENAALLRKGAGKRPVYLPIVLIRGKEQLYHRLYILLWSELRILHRQNIFHILDIFDIIPPEEAKSKQNDKSSANIPIMQQFYAENTSIRQSVMWSTKRQSNKLPSTVRPVNGSRYADIP